MPQKITQLQEQLETIIKGKKEITDKILMAVLGKRTCPSGRCSWSWKNNNSTGIEPSHGNGL